MLKQRFITALILIPITLLVIFYLPPPAFCLLTALVLLSGAFEWASLMSIQTFTRKLFYVGLVTLSFIGGLFTPIAWIFYLAVIWWLLALLMIIFYPRGAKCWSQSVILKGIMGILVLLPCWAALNYIRNQEGGFYGLLILLCIIWGADSGAYFVGKKWGKHLLAPKVSPGKSIEGVLGGLVVACCIAVAGLLIAHISFNLWGYALLVVVITVIFSVVGDLLESMVKRQANLKDSSQLLPGHGGLLDRIDSLTAAAPIFVFIMGLLEKVLN